MPAERRTWIVLAGLGAIGACVWYALGRGRPFGRQEFDQRNASVDASRPAADDWEYTPPMLYSAYTAGGPIVLGTITDVRRTAGEADRGELTIAIEEELRGVGLPAALDLPFERRPRETTRPPLLWDRVPPEAGKRVCVILENDASAGRCVLDIDGADNRFLPVLKRMVALETLPAPERKVKLLGALTDSSPLVRALATELLLAMEASGSPEIRRELLGALLGLARDPRRTLAERLQAASFAGFKVYDGFSADDPVNYEVLSSLTGLLTDPETRIRGNAAHMLHGYLLGAGTLRPSPQRIRIDERERVLGQLKKDIEARSYFADAAAGLLELFAKG